MAYENVVDAELLEDGPRTRERERGDLFGPGPIPELPAIPKADAYASYVPVAHAVKASRGDEAAMQKAAIRIGAMLGEDGFYRFPAGGTTVEGPNVRLAKALAIRWGAVAFGVEIDKIEGDRVYLTAVCVDLVNLVVVRRPHTQVLAAPPAKFANKADQRARWEAMQVQSAASKTVRGAILDCLPAWFVGPAFEAALAASRKNVLKEGQTIETARDEAVKAFGALKVTRAELEALLGASIVEWSGKELGDLRDLMRSIRQGETSVDEVFADVRSRVPAADGAAAGKAALGLDKAAKAAGAKSSATKAKAEPAAKSEPAAPELTPERAELIANVKLGREAVGGPGSIAAQKAAGIPEALRPEDMTVEQLNAFQRELEKAAAAEG